MEKSKIYAYEEMDDEESQDPTVCFSFKFTGRS
jgi:hypothetical protein